MMKEAQNGIKIAIIPIPHFHPMPLGLTTLSTIKAETHGMMRNGKNEAPIARPRHFAEVISEMMISFIMFVPDWPTQ